MKKQLLVALVSIALSLPVMAQVLNWEQTNGPSGGNTTDFHAGPDGMIFATYTEPGDPSVTYAVYRSLDYGNSWDRVSLPGTMSYVIGITNMGHVFALSDEISYRSEDEGNTWTQVSLPNGESVRRIIQGANNALYSIMDSLYVSFDNGQSWTLRDTMTAYYYDVNSLGQLVRVVDNELQLSSDDGSSWQVLTELDFISDIRTLAINSNDEILLGGSNLYKVAPDGSSWELIEDGIIVESVTASPSGTLFSIVYLSSARVSRDDGETWEYIGNTIPGHFEQSFEVSPDSVVYVSTIEGLYRSDDDGNTWVEAHGGVRLAEVSLIASDPAGNVYAATDLRVFKTEDGGDTWETVYHADVDEYFSEMLAHTDGDIFLISNQQRYDKSTADPCTFDNCGRLYRSADGGQTWNVIFSAMALSDIEITSTGDIYITSSYGLSMSQDKGETWEVLSNNMAAMYDLTIDEDDGIIFVNSWDAFAWTDDQGQTWTSMTAPGPVFSELLINSDGDLFTIVTTYDEVEVMNIYTVFTSTDRGETWVDITPARALGFSDFYIDRYDVLYLFSNAGLYKSGDGGNSWQNRGSILVSDVTMLETGTMYGAVFGESVWKSETFVSVDKIPVANNRLHAYPNPSSGSLNISYNASSQDGEGLRIYDVNGRMIRHVMLSSPGEEVRLSNLSPGVYLLKLGKEQAKVLVK